MESVAHTHWSHPWRLGSWAAVCRRCYRDRCCRAVRGEWRKRDMLWELCAILFRARPSLSVSFNMTLCPSLIKYWYSAHSCKTIDKITVTEVLQRRTLKGKHIKDIKSQCQIQKYCTHIKLLKMNLTIFLLFLSFSTFYAHVLSICYILSVSFQDFKKWLYNV